MRGLKKNWDLIKPVVKYNDSKTTIENYFVAKNILEKLKKEIKEEQIYIPYEKSRPIPDYLL